MYGNNQSFINSGFLNESHVAPLQDDEDDFYTFSSSSAVDSSMVMGGMVGSLGSGVTMDDNSHHGGGMVRARPLGSFGANSATVIGSSISSSSAATNVAAGAGQGAGRPMTRGYISNPWGNAVPQTASMEQMMQAARPMSSVAAAGYSTSGASGSAQGQGKGNLTGDQLNDNFGSNIGIRRADPLKKRSENSPEEQAREMEKEVHAFIEQSACAIVQGDVTSALETAKLAVKKERQLCKFKDERSLGEQNGDLSFCVQFTLARAYHANSMHQEAQDTYNAIVKNKASANTASVANVGRLRVNMGNIHFEMNNYAGAIKNYRMALDQTAVINQEIRNKITKNIALAFVKMGQYTDAIANFEAVVQQSNNDPEAAYNLLLCYYAIGDFKEMKKAFKKLLAANIPGLGSAGGDGSDSVGLGSALDDSDLISSQHSQDDLGEYLKSKQREHWDLILKAAKLVAESGSGNPSEEWEGNYDWVIDQLKSFALRNDKCNVASEMEMSKAVAYLRQKKYQKAIEYLKSFERKDKDLQIKASTNLSYIYLLEGDLKNAEKYADLSLQADKYNAKALVNMGNVLYARGEFEAAKGKYIEAIDSEADCIEAIYNLGLVTAELAQYEEALAAFRKLHMILPDNIEIIYQLATIFGKMKDTNNALEWYKYLVTRVPTDPAVLYQMGVLYTTSQQQNPSGHGHGDAVNGDETNAFNCYMDSYRYYPVIMDVISWLGLYYIKNDIYESALTYFERAAQIQPNVVDWQLMVASCYTRIGALQQAKKLYEDIHAKYPENIKCLECLKQIADKLGLKKEKKAYGKALAALEAKLGVQTNANLAAEAVSSPVMMEQQQTSSHVFNVPMAAHYQQMPVAAPATTVAQMQQAVGVGLGINTKKMNKDLDEDLVANINDNSIIDSLYN